MSEIIGVKLLSAAVPAETAQVHRLRGREEIACGFEFHVELAMLGLDALDEALVLAVPAEIELSRDGVVERRIFGAVSSVRSSFDSQRDNVRYAVTFVPRLFRMSLTSSSEVFLDKSVPEILQLKLERAGFVMGDDFELRLRAAYASRDFTMQYAETDHAFVSRLAEHWGITIFFEHRGERDVAIFTDENSGFGPTPGLGTATCRRRGEAMGVYSLDAVTRTLPGKVVVDDYNYRTPSVALRKERSIPDGATGCITEFGSHCKTPDEAELLAHVRADELATRRRVLEGTSDLAALAPGSRTTLDGHPRVEGEILIVSVEHEIEQPVFGHAEAERRYANRFVAISAATPFRPARSTPKPKIHGAITAIIESSEGAAYAEVDDDGRYHVRIRCDGSGAEKGKASKLVRMAQPHAGAGYGMHFPLRDGVEVMLTCLDGDPDRPIISGAVPNPQTPSVVGKRNGQRNVLRTGGGTEMNIDDTDGATRFKITVPHKNTFFQMGSPNDPTEGCSMGTDQDIKHVAGNNYRVHAAVNLSLDGGSKVWISAPATEIHGTATLKLEGAAVSVTGTSIDVEARTVKTVAAAALTDAAPAIDMTATRTASLHSFLLGVVKGDAAQLVASDALLLESAPVVVISGSVIQISGKSTVNITGGTVNITGAAINLNC